MKSLVLIVCVACGGNKPGPTTGPGSGADPAPMPRDTRTAIEKRRDTACEQVGAKLTQCAVADAKADFEAGKIDKKQFDADTAAAVQTKNTEEFVKKCEVPMSSRQVRVLEVCFKEEAECGPLEDCLTHLNDHPAKH